MLYTPIRGTAKSERQIQDKSEKIKLETDIRCYIQSIMSANDFLSAPRTETNKVSLAGGMTPLYAECIARLKGQRQPSGMLCRAKPVFKSAKEVEATLYAVSQWQPSQEMLAEAKRRDAHPMACIDRIVSAVNGGVRPVAVPGERRPDKKDARGLALAWNEALLKYGPTEKMFDHSDLTSRLAEFGITVEVRRHPSQVAEELIENETEFEVQSIYKKRNALSSQLRSFRQCILDINAGPSPKQPEEEQERIFDLTDKCVAAAYYYIACHKPITIDLVRKIMKKQGASIRDYRYAAWIRQRITGEPRPYVTHEGMQMAMSIYQGFLETKLPPGRINHFSRAYMVHKILGSLGIDVTNWIHLPKPATVKVIEDYLATTSPEDANDPRCTVCGYSNYGTHLACGGPGCAHGFIVQGDSLCSSRSVNPNGWNGFVRPPHCPSVSGSGSQAAVPFGVAQAAMSKRRT